MWVGFSMGENESEYSKDGSVGRSIRLINLTVNCVGVQAAAGFYRESGEITHVQYSVS